MACHRRVLTLFSLLYLLMMITSAEVQAGGAIRASPPLSDLINSTLFDEMLPHRNTCSSDNLYTYDAFITAAKSFPEFATIGDIETRKRELAAFFGQTSQQTSGGWPGAPGGQYSWGYCHIEGKYNDDDYCDLTSNWRCAPGRQYYGRGPMQLMYNYNYGLCGVDLRLDLLDYPELLTTDPVISFKSAIWFWMTPQPPKPSCHDVIIGKWTPTPSDIEAHRLPGYGVTTNIIAGNECGKGFDQSVANRIGYYKWFCDIFGLSYGDNLDCYDQTPFADGPLLDVI